jgi:hypothetical protein
MTLRKRDDTVNGKRKHHIAVWRIGIGRSYGPVLRQTID